MRSQWKHIIEAYGIAVNTPTIVQQWNCHAFGGAGDSSGNYNLETWRESKPDWNNPLVMLGNANNGGISGVCNW